MTAIAINPMIVSVSPIAEAPIKRIQPTEHGGGVKKVVAVVAAIAIPIAAPAIASSIGLSAAIGAATTATVGSVVGSAIVGAGLGAVSAKVTGQSVKTGAIMGAIGGGISGYFNAPTQAASSTPASGAQTTQAGVQSGSGVSPAAAGETGATLSGATGPTGTELLTDAAAGGDTLVNATTGGSTGVDLGAQLSNVTPSQAAAAADAASAVAAPTAGAANVAGTTMTTTGAAAPASRTFMETVRATGSAVASKLTNPETLANMTLQAGAMLAANAAVPEVPAGMTEEEQQIYQERVEELKELKSRDEAAFNSQMDQARAFLQQAEQYDPTYMAFQAGNKAAIENERKLREQLRRAGLSRGRDVSAAERRRMSLDASRDVSSKFDAGYLQGTRLQNAALSSASNIPQGSSAYYNALTGIQQTLSTDRANQLAAREKEVGNLTKFFGGLGTYAGNTPDEEGRINDITDAYQRGLNAGSGIA
jgi:hypothetical protein